MSLRRVGDFRIFGEIILAILCILPGLYFSAKSLQEPWTTARIARSTYSLESDHLATFVTSLSGYREEHIGGDVVQIALLSISNLLPESIGLLPIGSLLIAVIYYSLAYQISNSYWIAGLLALYVSWYYPILNSQFGTQTFAWNHILFLGFLYFFYQWIKKRTPALSIIILIIFISTFLHYHTTPMWITMALVVAIAAKKLSQNSRSGVPASWALALFCIIFYFSFDTVVYGNALVRLVDGAASESFNENFLGKFIVPLLYRETQDLGAFVIAPVSPKLPIYATLIVMLILTIPVGIWVVVKIINTIRSRNINVIISKPEDIFIWSVILVAIGHVLMYTFYGLLSYRIVPIAFPLILLIIVKENKRWEKPGRIMWVSLAACAMIGFIGYSSIVTNSITASETGLASNLLKPGEKVLADANTYASLLLNSATDRKIINFTWLNSDHYSSLVGIKPIDKNQFDYVVVDTTQNPIISLDWKYFEPWTRNLHDIDNNPELNRIYDSEYLIVFKPTGSPLPNKLDFVNAQVPISSFSYDAAYLFLAFIAITFFPGMIITYLMFKTSFIRSKDLYTKYTIVTLVICMSIASVTFIGYLANFINLSWFIPLLLSIPTVFLILFLLLKRPGLAINSKFMVYVLTYLIIAIIWVILSTAVKHYRTETRGQFTEFFLTQDIKSPDSLILGAMTHLDQEHRFEIELLTSSENFSISEPFKLTPNKLWEFNLKIPEEIQGEPIKIILRMDGVPYRQLRINQPAEHQDG